VQRAVQMVDLIMNISGDHFYIRESISLQVLIVTRRGRAQGLAFPGHDELEESTNKGNFKELSNLLAERNGKVKKVVLNAPGNNKLVAPEIQKDIAECFSQVMNVCNYLYLITYAISYCPIRL
jgi:hypothetical protein